MEKKEDLNLRRSFKILLLENPNYFGNLVDLNLPNIPKPVLKKVSDTTYEELTCIGYNPESSDLGAIVRIKLPNGYSGDACTDGSKEYVRFYLDYGDSVWIDEGAVNFDAHDLPFKEELCYAIRLKLDPNKKSCCVQKPILPKVRAILSWNVEPPTDQPDWLPIWGNRLECDIQIEPRNDILCKLIDVIGDQAAKKLSPLVLDELATTLDTMQLGKPLPTAQFFEMKNTYESKVEDFRIGHKALYNLALDPTDIKAFEQAKALKVAGLDIGSIIDFLKVPKFNARYEELKCVGLDREASVLHADIHIKVPSGYSGNLCQDGSREYVAFYMDFDNGWEYMGTTSVAVHDIPEMSRAGLYYLATLPVSLTSRQKEWCETGKARIRGILSWNLAPTPNDPDYVAYWGDWEECCIEIQPLPGDVPQGEFTPIIESVGSMPVALISSNGRASGTNSVGLTANDSPFDGDILIAGIIANAPNSSDPFIPRLKYRLMVKEPSNPAAQPWTKKFVIYTTTINNGVPGPQVRVSQAPDTDGWVDYYPDFEGELITSVERNVLGIFKPSEEGLHEVYIETDGQVASTHITSGTHYFMVDRASPQVEINITNGTGNCGKFSRGEIIEGTFSMADNHSLRLNLSVTPSAEANGTTPGIGSVGGPSNLSYEIGNLPGMGIAGTWQLNTATMKPCGYNIRIHGEDRTIVNSAHIGHNSWDIKGFCLDK